MRLIHWRQHDLYNNQASALVDDPPDVIQDIAGALVVPIVQDEFQQIEVAVRRPNRVG
jgi:hypothetical protein